MNKQDKKELNKLRMALDAAIPGSEHYKELLENRKDLAVAMKVEGTDSLIPGVKNETLIAGAVGVAEIGLLAKLQDLKFMPKNLFSLLPILKIRL